MLALRITLLRILRTKLNHLLTYCCRLFVTLEKVKPHQISNFQTLFAKHSGGRKDASSVFRTSFARSFVFTILRIDFPATPFFHNHLHCPGVWGETAPLARIFQARVSDHLEI